MDIFAKLRVPAEGDVALLRNDQLLISLLNPGANAELMETAGGAAKQRSDRALPRHTG